MPTSNSRRRADSQAGPGKRHPIGILIVDDSITARTVLARLIEGEADLSVAARVSNAEKAIEFLRGARVDVILLDLEMPGMGGLKALPEIIALAKGARILVVSSYTKDGAEQTLEALALGATDTFAKPGAGMFDQSYRADLLARIRELGAKRLRVSLRSAGSRSHCTKEPAQAPRIGHIRALAIGASTGGIHALGQLLRQLPTSPGYPIFVTQHLPPSFMPTFARQLSQIAGKDAFVAEPNMQVRNNAIYIAAGDAHLLVKSLGDTLRIQLDRQPMDNGCCPSVDPMFASLADQLGPGVLGVVLSGMGRDGVIGARRIVDRGGRIYAQDEDSCAVWGMPRAVSDAGLASLVMPPADLGVRIASQSARAR